MIRSALALAALVLLAACGGSGGGGTTVSSGGSGSTSPPPPPPPATGNSTPITVDGGPAALDTGPNAYTANNTAYVTITLCAPGSTSNCQTIDHVQVDTGSVGLRVFQSVLNSNLASALPNETDTSGNPVGECYGFVDGYLYGAVRQADFKIGGESVAGMPLQVVTASGAFAKPPSSCSAGGGPNLTTVQSFAANGILGIGTTATDCGTVCQSTSGLSAAIYYDCPASGCASVIARTSSPTAPFQQLPNPVAAMAIDNNGTLISLPAAPSGGEATMTGTLYFGIATQADNALGSATVYTVTTSSDPNGAGLLNVIYKGQTLNESFVDSGTTVYLFVDSTIPECTSPSLAGFYCPPSPLSLDPVVQGLNGVTGSAAFTLNNAQTLFATGYAVLPGLGADPDSGSGLGAYPNSFDLGLPFFYGRNVFTAIEGRAAGSTVGPYVAF